MMIRYISILRGINVGGKRKILMADLKNLYQELGFCNITSYIQSGNIIFDTSKETDRKNIAENIKVAIFEQYGFDVPVIIRTVDELQESIAINPFTQNQDFDIERLCLTFLQDIPSTQKISSLPVFPDSPDKYEIINNDVFIWFAGKSHTSKLTNNLFEKYLATPASTRNWKTVQKLYEIATSY
jgi:uncharacterized protein (DUF1697 family)